MANLNKSFKAVGRLRIERIKPNGKKEVWHETNQVVGSGEVLIASRLVDSADDPISHMAIGDDSTSVNSADVALKSELARVAVTTTRNGNVISYSAVFNAGVGTGAIKEAGLFNDGSAGIMLCRTVFGVKTKDPNDVITISWDITIEAE